MDTPDLVAVEEPTLVGFAAASRRSLVQQRTADYWALTKPRVVLMVLVTTLAGYYLAAAGQPDPMPLLHALFGTALAAGGTMALNQFLEHHRDERMLRTRRRPLPAGRLVPVEGLAVGAGLLAAGLAHLWVTTNPLATGVTATIAGAYLLLYTPLKTVTPLCSVIGAVPGALPPVAGWAAARGTVGVEALVLFAIMFLWQIPHTLAIGWLYRDDYARAGIRVLPVTDRDGHSTAFHSVGYTLALLHVALLPTLLGFAGALYFAAALVLGVLLLAAAVSFARRRTHEAARRLLLASLVHLPVLLALLALDAAPRLP